MKLRKLFFSLALMVFGLSLAAQQTISGKITDTETGDGLIGATVYLDGSDIGTVTDFDGNFMLEGVPSGEHTLMVSYTGYASMSESVSVGNAPVNPVSYTHLTLPTTPYV